MKKWALRLAMTTLTTVLLVTLLGSIFITVDGKPIRTIRRDYMNLQSAYETLEADRQSWEVSTSRYLKQLETLRGALASESEQLEHLRHWMAMDAIN